MDQNSCALNPFQNYDEFLQISKQELNRKKLHLDNDSEDQFVNDRCNAQDIDKIMKTKFYKADYPSDPTTVNIFCPLCGKMISSEQKYSFYQSENYKRKFLAHQQCLKNQSTRLLNDDFDHVQQMQLDPKQQLKKPNNFTIGNREFCLQLSITHPLSDFKFAKLVSKCSLRDNILKWEFRNEDEMFCYLPNMICFPFVDFKIGINLCEIGVQESKKNFGYYVNLARKKLNSVNQTIAKSENMVLEFRIYNSEKQKEQILNLMNYKYQYPKKPNLPIIQLFSLQIQIPEQQYNDQMYQNSNSTIVQLLSQKNEITSSHASSMHLYSLPKKSQKQYSHHSPSSFSPTKSLQHEQLPDLQKLISSNKLSTYVRNSTQSRIFQSFLPQASPSQIQLILTALYPQFPELVIDQYANYMTQKLFQVCTPPQRLLLLSKLLPQLPSLVRNKQGTHTIQSFLDICQSVQQQKLLISGIDQQFIPLSCHPIATHFIQKIIKIISIDIMYEYYLRVIQHFVTFATEKNGMCVMKYMLRRIRERDGEERVEALKKQFVNKITFNTDKIIQDCYGNYVIQFCYELFGESKSAGITWVIIEKFVQFSLQKYSSSVVSKCINAYLTDKSYVNKLKDCLKPEGIMEMFRNREGNKILLDLMDRNQNTPLRQKIYNVLSNHGEASKFYHDRWGMQIGIRSGPVGFQFKSFTDAVDGQQKKQNISNKKSRKK